MILLNPSSSIMRTGLFSLDLYFLLVGNPLQRCWEKVDRESFLDPRIRYSRESRNIVIRITAFIKYEFSQS